MFVGSASGNWTSHRICRGRAPKAAEGSTTSESTWRMPRSVKRTAGATAKMVVATTPMPKKHRGQQMDEDRHSLHEIQDRPDHGTYPVVASRENAERNAAAATTEATSTTARLCGVSVHRSIACTSSRPAAATGTTTYRRIAAQATTTRRKTVIASSRNAQRTGSGATEVSV
ncbi:hypothetical protein [Jidongwangia harbinensis]|uniref:hypothetical protein n=1 Tax=Jidongwangia harbinensis TaxID=2878561 RepID=UPI001CD9205B|nr:hypothetical protein [Jidongwangia harbinensis]MCA2219018.1 hypothetical protein [Jidongwangia harbinensis]